MKENIYRKAYKFVDYLSRMTIDEASLPRRSRRDVKWNSRGVGMDGFSDKKTAGDDVSVQGKVRRDRGPSGEMNQLGAPVGEGMPM